MIVNVVRVGFGVAKQQFMRITASAQSRLETLLSKKSDPQIIGIKISLTKKGCNGLSYSMNYTTSANKFDQIMNMGNYKIIVDSKALMALVGTEMDFVENDLGSEFVFNNPNEKGRCGCGESFHI